MTLVKKATILFPPDLHAHLVEVARQRGVSLGELVRSACEAQSGVASKEERLQAVERLRRLSLPVGTVKLMKRQSVPPRKTCCRDSHRLEHPHVRRRRPPPAQSRLRRAARANRPDEVDAVLDAEVLQEILHRYRAISRWETGREVFWLGA